MISVIAITALLCLEEGFQPVEHVTMMAPSGVPVTIRWEPNPEDPPDFVDYYEFRVHYFEWCTVEMEVTLTEQTVEFVPPRVGHFIASVRACNDAGCSEWAESINPEFTQWQGERQSWWIYSYLPAPTGGGLE